LAASYRSYEGQADDLKTGIVVKLPKLRTKEEGSSRFAGPEVGSDVPYHRFKIDQRRNRLDKSPWGTSSIEGEQLTWKTTGMDRLVLVRLKHRAEIHQRNRAILFGLYEGRVAARQGNTHSKQLCPA